MWICLNDAFFSIVKKDCPDGSLLVRARRPGDIEKVFGRRAKITRLTDTDYLYRAVIARDDVVRALQNEVERIDYQNFKDSVVDGDLHDAYMRVWSALATVQDPMPYSAPRKLVVHQTAHAKKKPRKKAPRDSVHATILVPQKGNKP